MFARFFPFKKRTILLVLTALLVVVPAPAQSLFEQVDDIVKVLSEITGWNVKRKVPSQMLSKEAFRKNVESRMKDKGSKQELRIEEITLKMFGFVPPDFNLARETVDLVSEQAAAYYDYTKKRLYVLDSSGGDLEQKVTLAHELAHALADQHHPLGKYLNKGSPDDDAQTAREAVMEGQATFLGWAYLASIEHEDVDVIIKKLSEQSGNNTNYPVFSKEPLYMRESLVFPYDAGLDFQYAIFKKNGRGSFDELFTHPPESTQQILHPSEYLEGIKPLDPKPPALDAKLAKQMKTLGDGSMGELDHNVLFRTYLPEKEAVAAAAHWRGGDFKLYEHKKEKYHVIAYISEWDSEAAARTSFDLYRKVMKARWKKMQVDRENEGSIEGTGDTGRFHVWVSGTVVQSIEGLR
jgi:hypothetical protein